MEDLPLAAYFHIGDKLIKRINHLQYCNKEIQSLQTHFEYDSMRVEIEKIKSLLQEDSKEKVKEDIKKYREVIEKRFVRK